MFFYALVDQFGFFEIYCRLQICMYANVQVTNTFEVTLEFRYVTSVGLLVLGMEKVTIFLEQ